MPAQLTYPGVYIEEVPSGVHTITGVSTSDTAFIDFFPRGPLGEAVRITSLADFQRTYGGLDPRSEASYAIQQFFLNGGSVGLPYEGKVNAYWVLIGDDFEMRHTPYDLDPAIDALRATGFPSFDDIFGDSLMAPASPEEATHALEEQAAGGETD